MNYEQPRPVAPLSQNVGGSESPDVMPQATDRDDNSVKKERQ